MIVFLNEMIGHGRLLPVEGSLLGVSLEEAKIVRAGLSIVCVRWFSSHVIGTGRFPKTHEMWHAVP